jgi:pimeloyl-ACP methyl ester carboxylesterase
VPRPSARARLRRSVAALALAGAACLAGCSRTVTGTGSYPDATRQTPSAGGATPSGNSPEPDQLPVTFGSCGRLLNLSAVPVQQRLRGKLSYGCATLQVPLDYADPNGTQIALQLVKVHDSDDTGGIGSLLVNPGGPGGSGVELALGLLNQISPSILQHFDLVGFDPRGVQLSSPIRCISDAQKDELNAESPDVLTASGFAQAKQLAAQVATACSTKYGPALAQFNTVNTARDMDRIRQAVGDPKMNYLGFSYGTQLGATYVHLFPGKVRVAVLDGAVDPLTSGITQFADQLGGFEDAFDQFADWCRAQQPCSSLGNPRQAVYDIVAASKQHPLSTSDPGETRQVTSSLVLTGVLDALYSKAEWATLGDALIQADSGNGKGLLALADEYNQRYNGQYTNIMDANLTISCNDEKPGPSDDTIRTTAAKWATKYPMFGLWAAISLFGCQQWQPDRTPVPKPTATSANTVLVIGNYHDPATPYQGAVDLAKTMGDAELLSWNGEGHTSYLEGSSCIDDYVNAYLISTTLPPPDTTCPR